MINETRQSIAMQMACTPNGVQRECGSSEWLQSHADLWPARGEHGSVVFQPHRAEGLGKTKSTIPSYAGRRSAGKYDDDK